MGYIRRAFLMTAMQMFDVVVLCFAFVIGILLSHSPKGMSLSDVLTIRVKLSNFLLFAALLVICHVIFRLQGLYRSKRLSKFHGEVLGIIKAVSLSTLVISFSGIFFQIEIVTSFFLLIFWTVFSLTLIIARILLRKILARVRVKGRNLRHILIVGTNPRAVAFANRIDARPELGYHLLGFADNVWPGMEALDNRHRLITNLSNLDDFLRRTVVDEVVISLPLKSNYQRIYRIVSLCEKLGIFVRLLGGLFDLKIARSVVERFEDETVVSVYTGRMEGWPLIGKRALDVAVSAVFLVLLSPLFLLVGILIKLLSPGPIFFVQERVGLSKRRFRLYKFRTMIPEAEAHLSDIEGLNEVSGPVFKIKNDPRLTGIGRFLRKTSIDEIPQLLNVLRGDMSLVGPRPLPVRDYNGFDEDSHLRRFSVRPGITCLWQVNGRSEIPFEKWMELDMQYIDDWSFWLDLKILVKTIPAVLKGLGAA